VLRLDRVAGLLEETVDGYRFTYDPNYLQDQRLPPVSLTLPKRQGPYDSASLFACFESMLAEGALAEVQCRQLRIDERDLFGRLLKTCHGDVIGSIRIEDVS
jgi:serine/threonine-protein kinase HipA